MWKIIQMTYPEFYASVTRLSKNNYSRYIPMYLMIKIYNSQKNIPKYLHLIDPMRNWFINHVIDKM